MSCEFKNEVGAGYIDLRIIRLVLEDLDVVRSCRDCA